MKTSAELMEAVFVLGVCASMLGGGWFWLIPVSILMVLPVFKKQPRPVKIKLVTHEHSAKAQ